MGSSVQCFAVDSARSGGGGAGGAWGNAGWRLANVHGAGPLRSVGGWPLRCAGGAVGVDAAAFLFRLAAAGVMALIFDVVVVHGLFFV
jgi:hypothetical protein